MLPSAAIFAAAADTTPTMPIFLSFLLRYYAAADAAAIAAFAATLRHDAAAS